MVSRRAQGGRGPEKARRAAASSEKYSDAPILESAAGVAAVDRLGMLGRLSECLLLTPRALAAVRRAWPQRAKFRPFPGRNGCGRCEEAIAYLLLLFFLDARLPSHQRCLRHTARPA